jgi:L-amino acid N-acyltransferase YncA
MDNLIFKEAEEKDLGTILDIYNFYILTSTASFDVGQITREEFLQRVFIGYEKYKTYSICHSDEIIGYCALTQFRKKKAYDRTAEIGIYLKPEFTGRGIGLEAITFLEQVALDKRIKVLIASISGENKASIKLFQKAGYEECAHYKEIGEKFGRILDVVDYQKILGLK